MSGGGKNKRDSTDLITRAEAKARGLTRYFTGIPCQKGHIAERNTRAAGCIECGREKERSLPKNYRRDLFRKRANVPLITHCLECGTEIDRKDDTLRADKKHCSYGCYRKHFNKLRQEEYRNGDPELQRQKRLKENSKVSNRILTRIRSRCKLSGLPFNLEVEDIVVPDRCPVLGIEILALPGAGLAWRKHFASVDRIVPELGYVKGNVRIISGRANLLKSNAEIWELEAVLADLKKIRGHEDV